MPVTAFHGGQATGKGRFNTPRAIAVDASSGHMNIILVFDLPGNKIGTLIPTPPDKLADPSGLALAKDKLFVLNAASARVSLINLQNR